MENYLNQGVSGLYKRAKEITDYFRLEQKKAKELKIVIPEDFKNDFFNLIDKINLDLLEDRDNFYGYFLFQMSREIRFDIAGPTAVNFKGAKYVIYFNPLLFLTLSLHQMQTTIKHEILHIVSMHLVRAKKLKSSHSALAVNMAMDIVVNQLLNNLPPYATTVEWVNYNNSLKLEPFSSFEYYVEQIQAALDSRDEEGSPEGKNLLEALEAAEKSGTRLDKNTMVHDELSEEENMIKGLIVTEYNVQKTHDIWKESNETEEKTQQEFVMKAISSSVKGEIPTYLTDMISALKNSSGELPWNLYLNRLMGTIEGNRKKTTTRRNRRQPERLDLRGELRSHRAKIIVALDISGSISEEEFRQAIKEVLGIVKNYNHEITVIECDDEIRRVYQVKTEKDIQERHPKRGATRYNPVFEYANEHSVNLLVYFTDGKGEEKLKVLPRGYKILWVISGRGEQLSLEKPYGAVKRLKELKKVDAGPDYSEITRTGYSMQHEESV